MSNQTHWQHKLLLAGCLSPGDTGHPVLCFVFWLQVQVISGHQKSSIIAVTIKYINCKETFEKIILVLRKTN